MDFHTTKIANRSEARDATKAKTQEILWEGGIVFLFGFVFYPLIELVWRGRTHISMALLGGLCLFAIRLVDRALGKGKQIFKALVSSLLITELEFLCGVLVNLILRLGVWDYSAQPFHLLGQICPLFSFFWFLLSLFALRIFSFLDGKRKRSRA